MNDTLSYYKLANLDGGIGQGADQLIVHDLTLFCTSAASLYSSIGKPFIDLCVFNYQLFLSLGPFALTGLLANYFVTATILRKLSPPFGKLKAVEGRKEGSFRTLHARLITNAEEIAFYGGSSREKTFLDNEFKDLRLWMEAIYLLKIRYNMLEVRRFISSNFEPRECVSQPLYLCLDHLLSYRKMHKDCKHTHPHAHMSWAQKMDPLSDKPFAIHMFLVKLQFSCLSYQAYVCMYV